MRKHSNIRRESSVGFESAVTERWTCNDINEPDGRRWWQCSDDIETIVLNDQGGGCMGCSIDLTGTLRAQEHGHQPIVIRRVSALKNLLKREV